MVHPNDIIRGTQNFTYQEAIRSMTAIRHGINNIPNQRQIEALEYTAQKILQPVRDQFGRIKINSGFSCEELCPFIPRKTTSNHTRGEAYDFESLEGVPLLDIGFWIAENLNFRELIFEYMPWGWIHCAARSGGNTNRIKIKDREHDYDIVSLDYAKNFFKKRYKF